MHHPRCEEEQRQSSSLPHLQPAQGKDRGRSQIFSPGSFAFPKLIRFIRRLSQLTLPMPFVRAALGAAEPCSWLELRPYVLGAGPAQGEFWQWGQQRPYLPQELLFLSARL